MTEGALPNVSMWKVGDQLPQHVQGPIDRTTLALFAGASNDHNPVHIDSDVAKETGRDDVFAHGMLSMAYLAQLLTRWVPQSRLLRWSVRFTAITPLHATVRASGTVTEILEENGRRVAQIAVNTMTDGGTLTLEGLAFVLMD
ncbi:MaoC/PaaZ C-terminal domain-containing protein [Sphingobium sp. SA916]|uniref:MaoC/PaaZ C-terminal domain-containing protein n=1 Tax=Sphingobium sp. SA916 TaxID=1851207 RepID=UPI000C9FA702|nr:MaoC/PaaZ C-terminal domain-containing protein [Sphingobium sp. SA916]PNQ02112.1 dehydratase [Sphingobium sp. SA916]